MADPELEGALTWALEIDPSGEAIRAAHEKGMQAVARANGLAMGAEGALSYPSKEACTAYPDSSATPQELRWWSESKKQCVAGQGASVDWCKAAGNLDWTPNADLGVARCVLHDDYCRSKGMYLIDGECRASFGTWLSG